MIEQSSMLHDGAIKVKEKVETQTAQPLQAKSCFAQENQPMLLCFAP